MVYTLFLLCTGSPHSGDSPVFKIEVRGTLGEPGYRANGVIVPHSPCSVLFRPPLLPNYAPLPTDIQSVPEPLIMLWNRLLILSKRRRYEGQTLLNVAVIDRSSTVHSSAHTYFSPFLGAWCFFKTSLSATDPT